MSNSVRPQPGFSSSHETILTRLVGQSSLEAHVQNQIDGLVGSFISQATEWKSLAALTAGGLAYRWGRIGVMSIGEGRVAATPLRALSVGLGLSSEVTAYEFTHRTLTSLSSPLTPHASPNLWSWSGTGGWKEGWISSFVAFGTIKGFGRLAHGQNLILQHGFQDTGMVLGHQLVYHAGLGTKPEGTFAEQFAHAEATNLQLAAGMGLGHSLTGGRLIALEKGLDLTLNSQERGGGNLGPLRPMPYKLALALGEYRRSQNRGSVQDWITELSLNKMSSLGDRIPPPPEVTNGLPIRHILRDYQEEASLNTIEAIKARKGNGLIILPTGTGKTVTFVEIAKRIAEQQLLGPGKKTLVLVHRVELVDQAKKAFEKAFGENTATIVSAGRDEREFRGPIVVAGVQTLVTPGMMKKLDPKEYGLVIVDETHHIVANTWRKILEHLDLVNREGFGQKVEGRFLLGVTATPDRSDEKHIGITFSDGLLFSKPLPWFVHRGYLLRPQGILMTTDAELSKVRVNAAGDYIEEELAAEMSRKTVLEQIVKGYEEISPGQRALVFASSVEHAKALADEFNKGREKPHAAAIEGTMDPDLRADLIEKHKRGELDLLINYGVLTEGYDDPGIETVIVARPTRSRALYTQMVGRGLRPDPEHPERKTATIIDITGDILAHALDMDLAKMFGVTYVEAGLPPTDVVKLSDRFGDMVKDPDSRQRIREEFSKLDSDMELQYLEIAMMEERTRPFPAFLREILSAKYGDDFSRMAWDLGLSEGRLTDYVAGILPKKENTVRTDFLNAEALLGKTMDEIIQLWKQSVVEMNLTNLLKAVRETYRNNSTLPLEQFIPPLNRAWVQESFTDNKVGNVDELLRYQLWEWERQGMDLREIEELFEKLDKASYKRSHAKADLKALTPLARSGFQNGETLLQSAREQGLLDKLPGEMDFKDFINLCQRKALHTGELTTILNRNKMKKRNLANPLRFYETFLKYETSDPSTRGSLEEFFQKELGTDPKYLKDHFWDFLTSSQPIERRKALVEWLKNADRLPLKTFRDKLSGSSIWKIFTHSPLALLVPLLHRMGMVAPEETAPLFLGTYVEYIVSRQIFYDTVKHALVVKPEESQAPLQAGSFSIPPFDDPAIFSWAAERLGTTSELLEVWSRQAQQFGIKWKGGTLLESRELSQMVLNRIVELVKKIDEENRRKKNYYYEDLLARMVEVSGLSLKDLEVWFDEMTRRHLNLSLPMKKPTTDVEIWLEAVRNGKRGWHRIDGQKDKQRKVTKAVLEAGLNLDEILQKAASWDPETVKGPEKVLITFLFDKERGAGFKKPKVK